MKHLLFVLALLLATAARAQQAAPPATYCVLMVGGEYFNGAKLALDYGQNSALHIQNAELEAASNQLKGLNSVAAALDLLAAGGWEYVEQVTMPRASGETAYLLRRRKP